MLFPEGFAFFRRVFPVVERRRVHRLRNQWGFITEKGDGPMNVFSQDELKALMGKHQGLCVSIFMPTYRTGAESQQNPIRFRNLLRTAEEKLLAAGLRPQEVKGLLEPAQALPGNVLFWRRQSDGLALFLSADLFRSCIPGRRFQFQQSAVAVAEVQERSTGAG